MRYRMRHKFGWHFWAGRCLINEFGQTWFPISYTAALISQHILYCLTLERLLELNHT